MIENNRSIKSENLKKLNISKNDKKNLRINQQKNSLNNSKEYNQNKSLLESVQNISKIIFLYFYCILWDYFMLFIISLNF